MRATVDGKGRGNGLSDVNMLVVLVLLFCCVLQMSFMGDVQAQIMCYFSVCTISARKYIGMGWH